MVVKLSERPEELVRQFLVDNLRPAEMQGYDPQQTNPDASDFLPVTSNWDDWGDHYPVIVVQENTGPSIPNSGDTNANGLQGNGSGPNQYAIHNLTLSTQAVQGGDYRNNTPAEDLVKDLYDECRYQIQNATESAVAEALFTGIPTAPTPTRSTEETDSGSTETWIQNQGTIPSGVIYEPQ